LCRICVEAGVDAKAVQGRKLAEFGVDHANTVHKDDDNFKAALAAFPFRKSRKAVVTEEIVLRQKYAPASALQKKCVQSSLDSHVHNVEIVPKQAVLHEVAKTMISLKMAPNAVEKLQPLVNICCAYGKTTSYVSLSLPARQAFVEGIIEGDDGLLAAVKEQYLPRSPSTSQEVMSAGHRFVESAKDSGVVLMFDSARDVNSLSIMPVMASTPAGKVLLGMPRPDSQAKTGEWIHSALVPFVEGSYDVATQERARSNTGRTLSAARAAGHLNGIANSCAPRVWMVATDHASAELKGMALLQESHGVIPCGDPSHAAHNTAKYLMKQFETELAEIAQVNYFFRNHVEPKNMLRAMAESEKGKGKGANANAFTTLRNNVETRFLSSYYMLLSYKKMSKCLKNVVNHTEWKAWWKSQKADLALEAQKVARTINGDDTELFVDFLCSLLVPLVKMCRFFDAARVGSIGFVYIFWSMLNESILLAIASPTFSKLVTPAIVDHIKETLIDCWERFDFDVYGAAFMLNPYFLDRVRALNAPPTSSSTASLNLDPKELEDSSPTEFFDLKEQVLRVVENMARRFPAKLEASARPKVLANDDPEVVSIMSIVRSELEAYLGNGSNLVRWVEGGDNPLPGTVWRVRYRPSKLRAYACMIVDATAGSPDVERMHWRTSRTRTISRNRLGYVRSQSLIFLDHHFNAKKAEPLIDWGLGLSILHEFDKVSDEDEMFLSNLDERIGKMEAAAAEALADDEETGKVSAIADDEDSEDEEPAETGTRRVRRASSRFYAVLEAERRRKTEAED
jgi:hypothetical protein